MFSFPKVNFEIAAVQKYAYLVELEKCCQTHVFLLKFVLIQLRTNCLYFSGTIQISELPALLRSADRNPRTNRMWSRSRLRTKSEQK